MGVGGGHKVITFEIIKSSWFLREILVNSSRTRDIKINFIDISIFYDPPVIQSVNAAGNFMI